MSWRKFSKEEQAQGSFDNGAIMENKPIGFPQDGGGLGPYSNLFYWAHAWSDSGGLIGLHPHQGFEILSFVRKGTIEHYDTAQKKWIPLKAGAVQIIRAGKGIEHSERLLPDSAIFQIWFDPDLSKSLQREASYSDYPDSAMGRDSNERAELVHYIGGSGPVQMETPGIESFEWKAGKGASLELDPKKIWGLYVWNGSGHLELDGSKVELRPHDFLKGQGGKLVWNGPEELSLFCLGVPEVPGYLTYVERMRRFR